MNGQVSYWTIRHPGGWGVKRQGNKEASSVHERQQDAWKEARRLTGGKQGPAAFVPPVRRMPAQTVQRRMPAQTVQRRDRLASHR